MTPADDFRDLIRRLRGGDGEAARALVERYEAAIRRAVRFRLTDTRLKAAFDSMDICQSVLGSFFVRAANGEYDLDGPEQLTRLLVGIARNKLASHARRQSAGKRDYRRAETPEPADLAGTAPSPSRYAQAKELLRVVRERLTPDERQLADFRQEGLEWAEIGDRLGVSPVVLRKRLSRAMDRVAAELDLDE